LFLRTENWTPYLIVQNIETTTDYYRMMWNEIRPSINVLPEAMEDYDQNVSHKAYNMGIFGGNDILFIKDYCKQALEFVDLNLEQVNKLQGINFNIFFEQVLLHELATRNDKDVATYIKEDIGDNEYQGFADFDNVPEDRKYLHLLGFYKKIPTVCNKMLAYVIKYYPEYIMRLEKLLSLAPIITELGQDTTHNKMRTEMLSYKESVLKGELETSSKDRNIMFRDIVSVGLSRELRTLLDSGEKFIMAPTNDFSLEEKCIKIKELYGNVVRVPVLSVDSVIFDIIGKKIDNERFCNEAESCLDDSFPIDKKQEFNDFLWKRISLLVSYGLLVVSKSSL